MKTFYAFILLCVLFCNVSCEKYRLSKSLNALIGSTIVFPDSLSLIDGADIYSSLNNNKARMIFWFDSTECVTCKLSGLSKYYELYDYFRSSNSNVDMLVIFSPSIKDLSDFRYFSLPYHFEFPVVVDYKNEMWIKNSQIPKSNKLHSFLIDGNNKVLMAGNPVFSQSINVLLKKTLSTMNQK